MRFLLMLLAAILAAAAPAAAQEDGPRKLVAALYAQQGETAAQGGAGPLSPQRRGDFFTPALVRLLEAEDRAAAAGEPMLGFDPFYDAQDFDIVGLQVTARAQTARDATIVASFANFGRPTEIVFDLVMTDRGWRIADVSTTAEDYSWRLTRLLGSP